MPEVRDAMDGAALMRWGRACLGGLRDRRDEINALNVFPIADADTGTNLLATMRAAVDAAEAAASSGVSTHDIAVAMAHGATLGARGNSGIILSQVLRGIAEAVRGAPLTAPTLRHALARAAWLVREGLSAPVEGTILTVLDCAAASAAACPDTTLAEVAVAAADGAAKALGETPSQLGVLREAGVVDAGARGLVVLLDGLIEITLGEIPARPEYLPGLAVRPGRTASIRTNGAPDPEPVVDVLRFEVMYLLTDTDDRRIAALRVRLAELGDSAMVVGDGDRSWSAHVHCADAGAAIEAGIAAGTLSGIRIESFVAGSIATTRAFLGTEPTDAEPGTAGARAGTRSIRAVSASALSVEAADAPSDATSVVEPADRGVLAVVAGAGAAALFEAAGAAVLGGDGQVTTDLLLAAIRRMPHREVLVLPNGALPTHELVAVGVAARDAHRDVLLLSSASMVQGLAAIAVHDRGRIAVDDAFAMSEAAASTRWGSLRAATDRALTMVGTCAPGDGLGLVGHDVVVIDRDVRAAGLTLLDRMLAYGGELVTLLMGAAAPDGLADELAERIARCFPGIEVTVYSGGQQADLAQIGVE